jgi:enamine deaminase RidA (YjgF/YER057c/UK114 family)
MLTKKIIVLWPVKGRSSEEQLSSCLSAFRRLKIKKNSVLKLSIFVRAQDDHSFYEIKRTMISAIADFFGPLFPPTSVIGQPPAGNNLVAVEITCLAAPVREGAVNYKTHEEFRYSVIDYGDFKEVHAAGLTEKKSGGTTAEQANKAFSHMNSILNQENLAFGDIIRQWNYIENITSPHSDTSSPKQNYQQFNNARARFYEKAHFPHGYPSATGIGMNAGGVVVEFSAVSRHEELTILPLSNPRQIDAHHYSDDVLVGSSTGHASKEESPKFERGKLVFHAETGTIYVAGTAAILGQKTVPENDAESQTRTTAENILALVSAENLQRNGFQMTGFSSSPSSLRVYVKKEEDIPRVKKICRDYFGHTPSLFVAADICRDSLLVEIEGIWDIH